MLRNCSTAQQAAWIGGLNASLWALRKRLGANKTVICNRTGKMYDCNGRRPCFCDGANKERFYGGAGDLEQVAANGLRDGGGYAALVHVPHIDRGRAVFNKALAGYLATASAQTGFGLGFGYPCDSGGWLRNSSTFPELAKPLGKPLAPPRLVDGVYWRNFTGDGRTPVRVMYNTTVPAGGHGYDTQACVLWSDNTTTDTKGGCAVLRGDVETLATRGDV